MIIFFSLIFGSFFYADQAEKVPEEHLQKIYECLIQEGIQQKPTTYQDLIRIASTIPLSSSTLESINTAVRTKGEEVGNNNKISSRILWGIGLLLSIGGGIAGLIVSGPIIGLAIGGVAMTAMSAGKTVFTALHSKKSKEIRETTKEIPGRIKNISNLIPRQREKEQKALQDRVIEEYKASQENHKQKEASTIKSEPSYDFEKTSIKRNPEDSVDLSKTRDEKSINS